MGPGTKADMLEEDEEELDEEANVNEGGGNNATIPSRKKYRFNDDWQKTFLQLLYENKCIVRAAKCGSKQLESPFLSQDKNANFK